MKGQLARLGQERHEPDGGQDCTPNCAAGHSTARQSRRRHAGGPLYAKLTITYGQPVGIGSATCISSAATASRDLVNRGVDKLRTIRPQSLRIARHSTTYFDLHPAADAIPVRPATIFEAGAVDSFVVREGESLPRDDGSDAGPKGGLGERWSTLSRAASLTRYDGESS